MLEDLNFGYMSIKFYIGKFPALVVMDPQAIPPTEDSQGGFLFDYDSDIPIFHSHHNASIV